MTSALDRCNSRGLLVHEWLEPHGGAERVVDALTELLPGTRLLTLWNEDPKRYTESTQGGVNVEESWISRTPLRGRKALSTPLLPIAWRTMRTENADWALVSSHLFAHHVRLREADAKKLVYVHTPARYLWEPELDERGKALAARVLSPFLRSIDRKRASDSTSFAANSQYVRERVRKTWGVESEVIYPPVAVDEISRTDWHARLTGDEVRTLKSLPKPYLLAASRFVRYKKIDDAIRAARVADLPIVIAGDGPEREALKQQARTTGVEAVFLGRVTDPMMRVLFAEALAYVFPSTEDFGIMPVESMASGTPVIGAVEGGGVLETVIPGVSGALADFNDPASIREALSSAGQSANSAQVTRHAMQFDSQVFALRVSDWMRSHGIDAFFQPDSLMSSESGLGS